MNSTLEKGIALYLGRSQKQLFRAVSHDSGNVSLRASHDKDRDLKGSSCEELNDRGNSTNSYKGLYTALHTCLLFK